LLKREVATVATRIFTPALEWLEGRVAPAILGGAIGGLSSLLGPITSSLPLLSDSAASTGSQTQTLASTATPVLTTPLLILPVVTLPSLTTAEPAALTPTTLAPTTGLTAPTLAPTTPIAPTLTTPDLIAPTLTTPQTPTFSSLTSSSPVSALSQSVVPAQVIPAAPVTTTSTSPLTQLPSAIVPGPGLNGVGPTTASSPQIATSNTTTSTTSLAQGFTSVAIGSVPVVGATAVAGLTPASTGVLTPTLPANVLAATQTPSAILSGPFQAGDTLTVAGTQTTINGQISVGHESERGPRITTPNGGGDDGDTERPPAPQAEDPGAKPQDQEPEQPLPLFDLGGVNLLLDFQPVRFEDGELESDATASDQVGQSGQHLLSLVLLTGSSLAAGSLALQQPRARRQLRHLHADPDDPSPDRR